MVSLTVDLTARVVIITSIYTVISYIMVQSKIATLSQLAVVIPFLFVMFGIVILISVLFDLWRYHVMSAMPVKAKIGFFDHTHLVTYLTARVVIITLIGTIISYLVIQRYGPWEHTTLDQLVIGIPILLAIFGIVMMITVPFIFWRYDVMNTTR